MWITANIISQLCYRLTKCPELCLGLFTIRVHRKDEAKPPPTLVGHIIATRTPEPVVTDASMAYPTDWRTRRRDLPEEHEKEPVGHQEQGGTVAIHSLAVLPEHQGKTVASTLMKSYIQRIKEAAIADRIALLCHDHLIAFYEKLGFENRGPSDCTFGGGGWTNMVSKFFYMVSPF
jgi:GNAT superfamily N-acetyltransferase